MKKKRLSLHDKAMLAMRETIRDVIERHKKKKLPFAVWDWKKKKVKFISPATALRQYNKHIKSEKKEQRGF